MVRTDSGLDMRGFENLQTPRPMNEKRNEA